MKTISVGYDFDEPIFPWYDLAHRAAVNAGLVDPALDPPTSWRPHKHYGCTLEEWVAVLDAQVLSDDGMYHQPFKCGVVDDIKRLYRRGYGIHIITARGQLGEHGERIKAITKSRIIAEGLPYSTLTFTTDKVPVALELGLDYMLDDAPHNVKPLRAAGVNCFLLDERWNQEFEIDSKFRVDSLQAFNKIVVDETCRTRDLTIAQRHSMGKSLQEFGRA